MRLWLKVYGDEPEYSGDCRYAQLYLTVELARLILARVARLNHDRLLDQQLVEAAYRCETITFFGPDEKLDEIAERMGEADFDALMDKGKVEPDSSQQIPAASIQEVTGPSLIVCGEFVYFTAQPTDSPSQVHTVDLDLELLRRAAGLEEQPARPDRPGQPRKFLFRLDGDSRYEGSCRFGMLELSPALALAALARVKALTEEREQAAELVEKHYFSGHVAYFREDPLLDDYAAGLGKGSFDELMSGACVEVERLPDLPESARVHAESACMIAIREAVFFRAMPPDGDDDVWTPEISIATLCEVAGVTWDKVATSAAYYYVTLDGGVDPTLSERFATEGVRDTALDRVRGSAGEDVASDGADFDSASDTIICLNVKGSKVEVWASN